MRLIRIHELYEVDTNGKRLETIGFYSSEASMTDYVGSQHHLGPTASRELWAIEVGAFEDERVFPLDPIVYKPEGEQHPLSHTLDVITLVRAQNDEKLRNQTLASLTDEQKRVLGLE